MNARTSVITDVQRHNILNILFILILASAVVLLPGPGHGRRTTTHTGAAGRTVSKSTGWSAGPSGVTRSSTATGPNGYNVNRSCTGTWDPVTNTWIKNSTTTGPGGNSHSTSRRTSFSQ